ncbi:MAG TPA: C39 family peptidase [Methanotrichaceae archaeon]|nr:C39 family peptidase [Methanotrichaceae archaeon]
MKRGLAIAALLLTAFAYGGAYAEEKSPYGTSATNDIMNSPLFLQVPDTRQSINYSCGAAAFQAVLAYWGIDIEEGELMKLLNTTPDYGTDFNDMARVAQNMGLEADLRENLTLEDLNRSIKEGVPPIIDCQSWRGLAYSNTSWAEDWYDGHYMVVLGIDEDNVYFEDPYTLGHRGFMPCQEFLERWHNPGGSAPSYSEKDYHVGIFIRGDKPSPYHPLIRIN